MDLQNKMEKKLIGLSYFRRCSRYLYELIESVGKVMNSKWHLISNIEERNVYDKTMKLKCYSHQKNKKTAMTNNRSIEYSNKELSDIEHVLIALGKIVKT
jgi:hypothetical protein